MNFEKYRSDHFRKLQNKISALCWIGSVLSLIVQISIFFLYLTNGFCEKGLIDYSISLYLWRGVIRPDFFLILFSIICTVVELLKFKVKIVNTATGCGFTTQYSKIKANGDNAIPLYKWITENTKFEGFSGPMSVILKSIVKKNERRL